MSKKKSKARRALETLLKLADPPLPDPTWEHRFHPTRRWRLDAAWPYFKVAVEVHGGVYTRGRHTRGKGFVNDREKMNEAQLHGWIVLEIVYEWIEKDPVWVITLIAEALAVQSVRMIGEAGIEVK